MRSRSRYSRPCATMRTRASHWPASGSATVEIAAAVVVRHVDHQVEAAMGGAYERRPHLGVLQRVAEPVGEVEA